MVDDDEYEKLSPNRQPLEMREGVRAEVFAQAVRKTARDLLPEEVSPEGRLIAQDA